jgi:RimJ/RimL family protein N-acetyltransferase
MDVTLETARLLLRQPRPSDAPRITRLINNFAVSGKLSRVPYPYKLSDAEWWLGTWRADKPAGETAFMIDLPGEGIIGNCGFHLDEQGIVIGYWLGEPYWNRGFMSEAARAAIDWYFGVTEATILHSGVFTFNKASLAVQKKLGFTEISTSRRHCLARQEDLRHIETRLMRARWDELRHGVAAKEAT